MEIWREARTLEDKIDLSGKMIVCENLVKIYKTKDLEVLALQGLDLSIDTGEVMAIIGNSGSGKSTLLNMVGGLDRPSAGRLFVDGQDLFEMNEKELVDYKQRTVGFVWQNNARNLIPYLNAFDNVMMPMSFSGDKRSESEKRRQALILLEMAGIEHKAKNKLSQLSGGEQQRVAIAIALANQPKLLLADEPTGSVDSKTSDSIFKLFRSINETLGTTVVIVTHDREISKKVNRVVQIRDGKTSSESIMRYSYAEELQHAEGLDRVHEEYAVLDRAGRVQIPKEMLEQLALSGSRVKMEIHNGVIKIEPPESDRVKA